MRVTTCSIETCITHETGEKGHSVTNQQYFIQQHYLKTEKYIIHFELYK